MTENLRKFLTETAQFVDETLNRLVPSEKVAPEKLHRAVRHSLFAGGKRFRPALVLAVGETFGVKREKLLRTASAVEMIHAYSLIHDDLPAMDDDDLRRGVPTCHIAFDEATAILAGDVLQTLAFQAIAEDESLSFEIRVKLIAELAKAAGTPFGMVAGQMLDLEAEKREISKDDLEKIHRSKTGAMISVSARSGAIIANASESELLHISNYAAQLGLLFQITDDLLDVTATTADLGKTAGKDERADKSTYPKLYGMETAFQMAKDVHESALAELRKIEKPTVILGEIADYILHRKS